MESSEIIYIRNVKRFQLVKPAQETEIFLQSQVEIINLKRDQTILRCSESQRIDDQIRIFGVIASNVNARRHARVSQQVCSYGNCVCGGVSKRIEIQVVDLWIVDALEYVSDNFNRNFVARDVQDFGVKITTIITLTRRVILDAS